MMLTTNQALITILILSLVTFGIRALPFVLFPGNKPTPRYILYLGQVLPYAAIGMLVTYCLKSIAPLQPPHALPELVAVVVIVALQWWKRNFLLSIGSGTVVYMLLVQLVFG